MSELPKGWADAELGDAVVPIETDDSKNKLTVTANVLKNPCDNIQFTNAKSPKHPFPY